MSAQDYRNDSFLDDRMLARKPAAILCNLDQWLADSREIERRSVGWIFHIGHVGSTLVSRLLGELEGAFAIREPRSLRDLSVFSDDKRRNAAAALGRTLSRRLEGTARPVVKATSFVSDHAPSLVEESDRALFLFATPRNYIASILAGPNSRQELEALTQARAHRLAVHGIHLDGADETLAHRAAAAWLTEMTSLERAAATLGDQVLWFDFDRMLGSMEQALRSAARHLYLDADVEEIRAIASGPLMGKYSKALEYDYSPSLRRDLLADADRHFGADIDRALNWLETSAANHSLMAAALARSD